MPIFEVPANAAGTPPEPPQSGSNEPKGSSSGEPTDRRRRYETLDRYDLLHVIDELEDDRSRSRLREMFWISIIAHLLFFWYLAYGPRYLFHHVLVRDPSVILKQRAKELTYLDLPPDVLKQQPRPKRPEVMSDKDRVAQSKNPTIDRKTLQQLEAMRRAGPPEPALQTGPRPAPQQPQGQPAPQQQAQQPPPPAPQPRPSQPLPSNQQAQLEAPAPKPAPTTPNFKVAPANPADAIQQAMRQSRQPGSYSGGGGDMGQNAPSAHPGNSGAVDVLSDTLGVDFGPYIQRVIYDTKRAWYPIIPQEAQPPINKQGKLAIRFKILPDGSVKNMTLEMPSGDVSLDRAAWGGITGASPYPSLPKNFKGPYLELRFYFLYNIRPDE